MTIKPLFILNYDDTKLTFGLPLEDISPSQDIHPYLKYLFDETFNIIAKSDYPIEEILENMQGTIKYRLNLKENIEQCLILQIKKLPGALLWVIRHFIGLLPLPVLPHYADGIFFKWNKLSELCKKYLSKSNTDEDLTFKINVLLMEDILKLPTANILFLRNFFNLIRKLIVLPFGEPRIHEYSANMLARYFCSALFTRPYYPSYIKNTDKTFHPLLLYLLLKWPILKDIEGFNNSRFLKENYVFAVTKSEENRTQALETIVEETDNKEIILINSSSQTDDPNEISDKSIRKCCCSYSSNYENDPKSFNQNNSLNTNSDLQLESSDADAKYGWIEPNDSQEIVTNDSKEDNSSFYYGWLTPELTPKHIVPKENATISFTDSGEYIYDEYDHTIYEDAKSNMEVTNELKLGEVQTTNALQNSISKKAEDASSSISPIKNPILEKISQIGWTYTKPSTLISQASINLKDQSNLIKSDLENPSSKPINKYEAECVEDNEVEIGWKIVKDNYKLCYGIEESNSIQEDTESNLSLRKSKVNMDRFKKIVSRMDILKLFKKKSIEKSSSIENFVSKIKYKKMKATRSNVF